MSRTSIGDVQGPLLPKEQAATELPLLSSAS